MARRHPFALDEPHQTNDINATADKVTQTGGTICLPPTDIQVVRFCVITDPTDAGTCVRYIAVQSPSGEVITLYRHRTTD